LNLEESYDVQEIKDPTESLKQAFRRHASGVCVITLNDASGGPVGFTATSVTSLGSQPALATFNVARGASSWPALSKAEFVTIQMLNQGSLELAKKMSQDHTKRFLDDDWFSEPNTMLPIFNQVNAVLICKVRERHEVELNAVIVVEIVSGLLAEELPSLLYHHRGYVVPGERLS
jgi:flavin reductase (DIM6/NTAB) family NADH-FMN oxidoreductase RutF